VCRPFARIPWAGVSRGWKDRAASQMNDWKAGFYNARFSPERARLCTGRKPLRPYQASVGCRFMLWCAALKGSPAGFLAAIGLFIGGGAAHAQTPEPQPSLDPCRATACPEAAAPPLAQSPAPSEPLAPTALPEPADPATAPLDLPPGVIESSPVLRQWLERTPDIAAEIANDPSFRTRLRLGYAQFPSSGNIGGFSAGVEDVFVWPGTGLTVSGDYARSWNGDRESYGAEARYYVFPLGGYVNFAPVVGYRQLSTPRYSSSGVNVGMRLMIIPSRGGGADVAISQTWVAPGTDDEVGLTGASVGYAVTNRLRLSTDLQFQNSRFGQDSRLGINLEWLL
jgi:hypothetical protein